jgi:hypothetical protein
MASYRVLEKSYINNSIVEEGAVVEFDGIPADNLEALDQAAEQAAAAAVTSKADSAIRQAAAAATGDPANAETLA